MYNKPAKHAEYNKEKLDKLEAERNAKALKKYGMPKACAICGVPFGIKLKKELKGKIDTTMHKVYEPKDVKYICGTCFDKSKGKNT